MLAGGQGAPLVPLLDYVLFADAKRGRVLQNIGGIANLTAIPAGGLPRTVIAFDTGPGNMVIDWLAQKLFDKPFDRNGALAARGTRDRVRAERRLAPSIFQTAPAQDRWTRAVRPELTRRNFCVSAWHSPKTLDDALATATALPPRRIAQSYARDVQDRMKGRAVDFIVSGGGARNRTLMKMLAERLEPLGCVLRDSDAFGLPAEAKEAAAFALLAWCTWHRLPGNVPSATGAQRAAILGQVTYA